MSTTLHHTDLFPPSFFRAHNDITLKRAREFWFRGGRGSGKSTFIGNEILLRMMDDAQRFFRGEIGRDKLTHAMCYRKVGADCLDSVFAQFQKNILRLGLQGVFRAVESRLRIYFLPTMQMIRFRGLDEEQKQKSAATKFGYYGYVWFEELTQFHGMKEIRSVMQSIIRGGDEAQIFASYNPPPSMANWVNAESLKPKKGRFVYQSDYRSVPVEWLGQPFVDEAEALKQQDLEAYRHEYLGEITGTGTEIFRNVEARRITDEQIENEFRTIRIGLDFGFENDPTALVFCNYDEKRNTIYIFDEWVKHGQFEEAIFDEIKKRNAMNKIIIADSAESRSIARLNNMGARRVIKCYKAAGYVNASMVWLRNTKRRIVIDPLRCPKAWEEFSRYEFAIMSNGVARDEYPDKNNHTIDAVRYALENEIRFGKASRLVV